MYSKINIALLCDGFVNKSKQIRCLSRWASRKPVKVIPGEEYDEEQDTQVKNNNPKWTENYFKNKSLQSEISKTIKPVTISKRKITNKITMDMLETTIDEEGNFIYTKMKNNDTRITTVLTAVKSNKNKDTKDLMLLEGKRLIKDALDAKCKLEYILFSRLEDVEYLKPSLPKLAAKLYKMPYREIQMWSDLTTSPGIMGIFKIPDVNAYTPPRDVLPLTIICDTVREADNLGAILRTSSGVGCEKVLLSQGCVNVWDTKVLRSGCGAHFKLKITKNFNLETAMENLPADCNIFVADNKTISITSDNEEKIMCKVESIPLIPYYGLNFNANKHNVLIVGGETEGISEASYQLVSDLKGARLNIPLGNNVESLNVGTALGIIVFEMKRQYLISNNCVKTEQNT